MQIKSNEIYGKTRCPRCAERGVDTAGDNLALYMDGHKHCYGCGLHVHAHGKIAMDMALAEKPDVEEKKPIISFPHDVTSNLPYHISGWLSNYEITSDEVLENGLKYSPSRDMLIFPFYHETDTGLAGWLGRCFKHGWQKYYMCGPRDKIFYHHNLIKSATNGIIVVEDCVSAIKVGRQAATIPLLGSNFSVEKRVRLGYMKPKQIIFWLDYDKAKEAYEYANQCKVQGIPSRVIITEQDPKEFSDVEIKEILEGIDY